MKRIRSCLVSALVTRVVSQVGPRLDMAPGKAVANAGKTAASTGPGTAGVISRTIGGPGTMEAVLGFRW